MQFSAHTQIPLHHSFTILKVNICVEHYEKIIEVCSNEV